MGRENLESAITVAYEYSYERGIIIDKYLNEHGVDENLPIEMCYEHLTDKQVKELFIQIFN